MAEPFDMAQGKEKKTLGFEITPTGYVIYSLFNRKTKNWGQLEMTDWKNKYFYPSPMSAGMNYGLSVFEGMKAFRHESGEVYLFRPKDHAQRLNQSLKGLAMKTFPELEFLRSLLLLVVSNSKFIPAYREGSLYIRPMVWGNDRLGFAFHPDIAYTAAFWCSPVDDYYTDGLKPIAVYIMREMTRAMPGGLGYCKTSGNYEISRMAQLIAKENSCNDALFLDGKSKKHIEELGAANVFMVKNGMLYTPLLRDTILPGITRKSILVLAKSELRLRVKEKDITVKELLKADEIFATGTAAVITPIGKVRDGKREYLIGNGQVGPVTKKLYDLLTGIQYGEVPDKLCWLMRVVI